MTRRDIQDLGRGADRVAGVVARAGGQRAAEDGLIALRELAGHGTAMIRPVSAACTGAELRHLAPPRRDLLGRPGAESIDEVTALAADHRGCGAPRLGVADAHAQHRPAALQGELVDAQIRQLVHRHELHCTPQAGAKTGRRTEPAHSRSGIWTGQQDQVVRADPGGLELGLSSLGRIGIVEDGQRPAGGITDQPPAHRSLAAWAATADGIISMARSGQ